jgi:hypothetical protein
MENKMWKHLEGCGFHIRENCVVDPDLGNPKWHPKMEKFRKILKSWSLFVELFTIFGGPGHPELT